MKRQHKTALRLASLLSAASGVALLSTGALAQADQDDDADITEILVIGDPVGLLEDRPTDSVLGLDRSVLETPRSFSVISETTMDRYSISDIDDFITTTPGTFGGSFFGIPGSISIRGSRAENYFRGFKRVVNNGFFPTPIGASERVEIIRGPTPAIYGAGRIGGLLNFQPKTTAGEGMTADDGPSGSVSYTGGTYSKNNVSAELNLPFLLDGRETGVSLYGEFEDSKSFYRNREPEHQLVQFGFNHDLGNGMKVEFGGMYHESEGYYQTPGWNRLTQDLIDNGTYITGRDTDLVDTDGNGRLTTNEVDAAVGTFFGTSNIRVLIDFGFFGAPPAFGLDEGVGTTQLNPRTVFLSENDEIEDSENITLYFDLIKEIGNSELKLQFFYDELDARIGLTTGFAAEHQMDTFETRLSYDFSVELGDSAKIDFYATASHKIYNSELRENFLSGYLVLDRRDLSFGATGSDIFDTPFTEEPGGINIPWDSNFDSRYKDTGVALVADLQLFENFSILLNGRYDDYSARSIDTGATVFDPSLSNTEFSLGEDDFSYSASASYNFGGVVPYFTYAEGSNILENSNGGVSPGNVRNGSILADSELVEAGLKFSLVDSQLNGSIAYYEQKRSVIDAFGNIDGEIGEGVEVELRYLVNKNWTLTGAATFQKFDVRAPGFCFSGRGEFVNIPPSVVGLTGVQGYGGIFAALNASCLPELSDGYQRNSLPETVLSSFVTYTSDESSDGLNYGGTFGGTYVSKTGGKITNAVEFPSYVNFRAAIFAEIGRYSLTATAENLFDKRYFVPLQGVFEEVGALPGTGREVHITGKVKF